MLFNDGRTSMHNQFGLLRNGERAIVFANPNYEHFAGTTVQELTSRSIPVLQCQSSPDLESTERVISDLSPEPGDVFFPHGGDGTSRMLIRALRSMYGDSILTPVCPLRGGNSGDITKGAHGRSDPSIDEILRRGRIVPAHTIDIRISKPDGTITQDTALSYASLGWSAEGAGLLDDNKRRKIHPSIGNIRVALAAFFSRSTFRAESSEQIANMGDWLIVNGGTMAKGLMNFPDLYHWGENVRVIRTAPSLAARLGNLTAMALGIRIGTDVTSETLTLHSGTLLQLDGEPPTALETGTKLTFRQSTKTFPLVVTHQSVIGALKTSAQYEHLHRSAPARPRLIYFW